MHRTFPACKILLFALLHQPRFASAQSAASMPYTASLYRVAGVPVDFMMSGVTLLGAALLTLTLCASLRSAQSQSRYIHYND